MAIRKGNLPPSAGRKHLRTPGDGEVQARDAKGAGDAAQADGAKPAAESPSAPPPSAPALPETEAGRQLQREDAADFVKKQADAPAGGSASPLNLRLAAMTGKVDAAPTSTASAQMSAGMDAGHDKLDEAAWFTSAPGAVGRPNPDARGPELNASAIAHGFSSSMKDGVDFDGDGYAEGSSETGATVSRAGVSLGMGLMDGDVRHDMGVFIKKGFQNASYGRTWGTDDGGAMRAGGALGGNENALVLGGDIARSTADGLTGTAGAVAVLGLKREATDLGDYGGDDEDLKGTRRVQVEKHVSGSGIGSLGVLAGATAGVLSAMGIGGRIAPAAGKKVTYRTHLKQADARELVHEGRGVAQFLRDKARAAGLKKEPLDIPDLSRPETLNVGDELIVETSGGISGGVVVGGFGFGVGAQGMTQGDFEIAVRRLDENRMEVVVTPQDVKGMQISAAAPFVLEVGQSRTEGRSLRQGFVFDLSKADARAAYDKALQGDLPNGLHKVELHKLRGGHQLADMVKSEQLPPGVERTYLEAVHGKETRTGGGLNWGVIHSRWGLAGLAAHTARVEESRVLTDGDVALMTNTRGVESRKQVLISGVESLGVLASVRRTTEFEPDGRPVRKFHDLELQAQFSDDTVRGLELNGDMIDKVNGAFGTEIKPFTVRGKKQSRSLVITRRLSADDIERLANLSARDIQRAAASSNASPKALLKLVSNLQSLHKPATRALRIQSYVAKQGLPAMGALQRALGADADKLDIKSTSSAYSDPITRASELAFEFPDPIAPDVSKKDLTLRFKEAEKALEKIGEGFKEALDDPLITQDERYEIRGKLDEARTILRRVIDFDHLSPAQRGALYDKLDKGWTTGRQKRIMALLRPPEEESG